MPTVMYIETFLTWIFMVFVGLIFYKSISYIFNLFSTPERPAPTSFNRNTSHLQQQRSYQTNQNSYDNHNQRDSYRSYNSYNSPVTPTTSRLQNIYRPNHENNPRSQYFYESSNYNQPQAAAAQQRYENGNLFQRYQVSTESHEIKNPIATPKHFSTRTDKQVICCLPTNEFGENATLYSAINNEKRGTKHILIRHESDFVASYNVSENNVLKSLQENLIPSKFVSYEAHVKGKRYIWETNDLQGRAKHLVTVIEPRSFGGNVYELITAFKRPKPILKFKRRILNENSWGMWS